MIPFALALVVLAREPVVLPHIAAVALAILWRALRDPTRATPIRVSAPPVLVARALAFRYPSGVRVGPLSLDCAPGAHRLQGANGTGKSTLLRCIAGDLTPASGTVRVNGRDPRARTPARTPAHTPAHIRIEPSALNDLP